MFMLVFGSRVFLVMLCTACAVGYTPAEFFDMAGLGWLIPYLPHRRV